MSDWFYEYREVAKLLPKVIGFENVNMAAYSSTIAIENHVHSFSSSSAQIPTRQEDIHRISTDGSVASKESNNSVISYQDFIWRMGLLQKQKSWVDSIRRRSSLHFQHSFILSEKEAQDKFLLLLARGVEVMRHQSYCHSETVRLFSSNGCRTINWSKVDSYIHTSITIIFIKLI